MNAIKRSMSLVILIAACAGGPFALQACAGGPTSDSTGEYIDDATITAKVKAAFVDDKRVSALNINVETFHGTVQLSGFANSAEESSSAAQIARNVKGVKSVKNDIELKRANP